MEDSEIKNIKTSLNSILISCGWTEESLFEEEIKVPCPLNANHMVPESSFKGHVEHCKWLKNGYLKEEMEKAPPSSCFAYDADISPCVTLDKELLMKITSATPIGGNISGYSGYISSISRPTRDVPKTMDRFTVEFTPQERLAVYDYVVGRAKEARKASVVKVEDLLVDFEKKDDKDNKPKSRLEILAEERDYKRRRPTYRAKNVHITKKSYTERMKEVIENQMTYLTEIQKQSKTSNSASIKENSFVTYVKQEDTFHQEMEQEDTFHKEMEQENSHSNMKQEKPHDNCVKETYKKNSDDGDSDNTDYNDYRSDRHSKKSHERSHHKHKRSRSGSRERHRHSDSRKHKSSHHDRNRKHRKH